MVGTVIEWFKTTIRRVTSWPVVAHALTANQRYISRLGPQFAGAVTYFSVLSMVPVLMFAFSMLGMTLTVLRPELLDQVKAWIDTQLDGSELSKNISDVIDEALNDWASLTIVALVTAGYSGSRWVGNLKRAVRVMWADEFEDAARKPNFFIELALNIVIFLGLLVCIAVGLGVASVGAQFSEQIIAALGLADVPRIGFLFQLVSAGLSFVASWLLVAFLFTVFPHERARPGAWFLGTLLGAFALAALQQVAGRLVAVFSGNDATGIFGPVIVVMLVFNVLATIILMVAAWVGTDSVWAEELAEKQAAEASATVGLASIHIGPVDSGSADYGPRRWAARSLDDLRHAQPLPQLSTDPERRVRQDVAARSVKLGTTIGYGVGAATGIGVGAVIAWLTRLIADLRRRPRS